MSRKRHEAKDQSFLRRKTELSQFALWRFANGEVLTAHTTAIIESKLKTHQSVRLQYWRLRQEARQGHRR